MRYSDGITEITFFGMGISFTLPTFGWKNFNSWRDESDEPLYIY